MSEIAVVEYLVQRLINESVASSANLVARLAAEHKVEEGLERIEALKLHLAAARTERDLLKRLADAAWEYRAAVVGQTHTKDRKLADINLRTAMTDANDFMRKFE